MHLEGFEALKHEILARLDPPGDPIAVSVGRVVQELDDPEVERRVAGLGRSRFLAGQAKPPRSLLKLDGNGWGIGGELKGAGHQHPAVFVDAVYVNRAVGDREDSAT